MKKNNFLKFGLTALMMAFAMTLCFSCSSDDDEETKKEVNPPSDTEGKISDTINGHAYVELAGYKWATENVGNVDEDYVDETYGYYYYTQDNAKKAAESWGGTWKFPTEVQWQKLIKKCNWTWQDSYPYKGKNVPGVLVEGKEENGEEGNSIFLPAAGIYLDNYREVYYQGYYGFYWSTVLGSCLLFDDGFRDMNNYDPDFGMAVRPVSD